MTSHNRCATTLAALDALDRQCDLPSGTTVHTHLVDAGSTDGTAEAVRRAYPDVEVTSVSADVYWGHGMRIASRNSQRPGTPAFTHQLWLNDDVRLERNALAQLLAVSGKFKDQAVVVGGVRSQTGTTTYSGRRGRTHTLVEPTGLPEPCDTYNGNVVLLPRAVHDLIGDIDRVFRHGMGDYDHGYRARRAGIAVYVAPQHVGTCDLNPKSGGSRERGIGLREALRRKASQGEMPPRQWWVYCWRHTWPWAPVVMVSPYVKTVLRAAVAR